jgi:hypothetical protein
MTFCAWGILESQQKFLKILHTKNGLSTTEELLVISLCAERCYIIQLIMLAQPSQQLRIYCELRLNIYS